MADDIRSDGEGRSITFLPGDEPGDFALGLPYTAEGYDKLAAYKLRMAKMRTGANVASKFPWLRVVQENLTANEQLTIRRNAQWPATFFNNSDHLVEINELRFRHGIDPTRSGTWQTDLWCKLEIIPRKSIIADWMPVGCLNTEYESSPFVAANLDSYVYELPAPYLLQRANPFVMDIRYALEFITNMSSEDWVIMCGLHGVGVHDGEPISLMKAVRGWPQPTGVAGQWQTIVFDEEQDRAMRDAWITHMTWGAAMLDNTAFVLEAIEVRPTAPEGPSWHQSEFFHLRDIAEHISMYSWNLGHGITGFYTVHRPIIPYYLERGEGLQVTLWNRYNGDITTTVVARGTQVGPK